VAKKTEQKDEKKMANGNGNGKETKERIMSLLNKRPVGLTIRDIAQAIGAHRQTVAKYVLVLEAEGRIHRRVVGSASLHYPKEAFDNAINGTTPKKSKKKSKEVRRR
jgi:response regulator of citrate/malate metabolism